MSNQITKFVRNRSLGFKLSAGILFSILIGSFLLSIFISNYSKPLLKEQVVSAAYKALAGVNYNIAQGADVTEQSLVNTANILQLSEVANDKQLKILAKAALEAIRAQYGHFYEFFIYVPSTNKNESGTLYYSYEKNGEIVTVTWENPDFAKGREWYNAAIQSGKIHWTEPYMAIEPDGSEILSATVSIPFKYKGSSSFNGVIGTSGNLDALRQKMSDFHFEANGQYLLTSAKGLYLIHPNKDIELKKTLYQISEEINSPQLKYADSQIKGGESGIIVLPRSSVYNSEAVVVYMPIPRTNWSSFLVYSSADFYKPVKHFQIIMLSVTLIGVLLLILLINWICKFTTNPIASLSHIAEQYGRGEFSAPLPTVESTDEVGILTQAFYNMRDNLLNLMEKQKEIAKHEQKMASELEIATKIQASALPVNFPQNPYFEIFASMTPAKEVGGDFYDFFYVDENHFAFLIADVSGKGIPAALFMMNSKSLLKSNILSGSSLEAAVNKTNRELCSMNNAGLFLTAFISVFNIQTGEFEYINAGHNPPLINLNGKYEYLQGENNLVISAMEDFEYKSTKIFLPVASSIFLYTDGIVEAQNTKEEFYGEERLLHTINQNNYAPKNVINSIKTDVSEFCEGASQFDDITMISFKYISKIDNKETYKCNASIENYTGFLEWLNNSLCKWNIQENLLNKIDLCAEEIFVNIASYAYKDNLGTIEAVLEKENDNIILHFKDNGTEYNPLDNPEPDITLSADERQIGGLGIHLVKQITKNVIYSRIDDMNVLTLIFDIN